MPFNEVKKEVTSLREELDSFKELLEGDDPPPDDLAEQMNVFIPV